LFLIDDRIFFSIVWLRNSSCNQLEGEHDASSNHNSVIETNEHNNQSISIENNSTVVGCTSSISGPSTTTEVISTTPTAVNQQLPSEIDNLSNLDDWIDPHNFLPENDRRNEEVVQPIVSELNNMPMEIEQIESSNMLLLAQLNNDIGGVTLMNIKVAGRTVPFQSWHYKRDDPVPPNTVCASVTSLAKSSSDNDQVIE